MVSIIYFFNGRSQSKHKKNFFQLAGALMEHFIEGIPQILYLELFNQSLKRLHEN